MFFCCFALCINLKPRPLTNNLSPLTKNKKPTKKLQDTSRNFLASGVADRKKYELFMEGTLLASVEGSLRVADGHVAAMESVVRGISKDWKEKEKRLKELEAKLAKLVEADDLVGVRTTLERASFWVAVEEADE